MKTNIWLLCGAFLAASLSAQQVTNSPPAGPLTAPSQGHTNGAANTASASKSGKASSAQKKNARGAATLARASTNAARPSVASARAVTAAQASLRTAPLKPGPAMVVASNVNVRAQARLAGEVVTRLTKGQQVTVLEEIVLQSSGPEEPSAWAKISLPQGAKVWVSALYLDATEKTVTVPRLNLRGGPGENYSVLGRIEKGYKVRDLQAQGDWLQIEAPEGAYAFVAAQYLKQDDSQTAAAQLASQQTPGEPMRISEPATPPRTQEPEMEPAPSTLVVIPTPGTNIAVVERSEPAAPVNTEPEPSPTLTPVVEPQPVATTTTDAPVPRSSSTNAAPSAADLANNSSRASTEPASPNTPATPTTAAATNDLRELDPEHSDEPITPRVVSREGVVRGSMSVQAPSHFELYSPDSKRIINYLYNPSPDLDLSRYKGLRIIVTGQEGLDERWRNTPLLTIQKIQVLE